MPLWIHCDGQAQAGDLRRVLILTSDELRLGPRGLTHGYARSVRYVSVALWTQLYPTVHGPTFQSSFNSNFFCVMPQKTIDFPVDIC
jgi:hypothetical protein